MHLESFAEMACSAHRCPLIGDCGAVLILRDLLFVARRYEDPIAGGSPLMNYRRGSGRNVSRATHRARLFGLRMRQSLGRPVFIGFRVDNGVTPRQAATPRLTPQISAFVVYADGQLKLPPKWLPATSNVVTFPKKSA
jgi:hypothetical protein